MIIYRSNLIHFLELLLFSSVGGNWDQLYDEDGDEMKESIIDICKRESTRNYHLMKTVKIIPDGSMMMQPPLGVLAICVIHHSFLGGAKWIGAEANNWLQQVQICKSKKNRSKITIVPLFHFKFVKIKI